MKDKEEDQIMLLHQSMDRKRNKIKNLKRISTDYHIRMALFKWRMTTVFMRLIDELACCFVDKDGFRVILQQDLVKLFLSNSMAQMQSSLEDKKVRIDQMKYDLVAVNNKNYKL